MASEGIDGKIQLVTRHDGYFLEAKVEDEKNLTVLPDRIESNNTDFWPTHHTHFGLLRYAGQLPSIDDKNFFAYKKVFYNNIKALVKSEGAHVGLIGDVSEDIAFNIANQMKNGNTGGMKQFVAFVDLYRKPGD
jgi:hypothetical protein